MSNSDDFWLISVPGEKTPQEAWEKLFRQVQSIASIFKFNIPNLKVGTLDQLFGLSDELNKLDSFVESLVVSSFAYTYIVLNSNYFIKYSVTRKVAQYLSEVLEHEKDKLAENLMANNGI